MPSPRKKYGDNDALVHNKGSQKYLQAGMVSIYNMMTIEHSHLYSVSGQVEENESIRM